MADVRAGGAFVELSLKSTGFQQSLTRIERRLRATASSIDSIGNRLLGFGAVGAAAFLPMVKAASDAQEQMSQFDIVFADQADAVKKFADTLANQIGRSKNQIIAFLASSQDLFVPLGFDRQRASELSKTLTQLTFDLSSFKNVAEADVLRDLQAALSGSSETVRKYGVDLKESRIQQELFNAGIDPKRASELQKVLARLNIIMRDSSDAQGDAARTADSFANQMRRLQGAFADANAELGAKLLPSLTKLVASLSDGITKLDQFSDTGGELAVGLAATAAASIALGAGLKVVAAGFTVASVAVGAFNSIIAVTAAVVGTISAPLVVVGAAIVALGVYFTNLGGRILDFSGTALSTFLRGMSAITNLLLAGDIEKAGEVAFAGLVSVVFKAVQQMWGAINDLLRRLLSSLQVSFYGFEFDPFASARTGIDEFDKALQTSVNVTQRRFDKLINQINKVGDASKQAGEETANAFAPQDLGGTGTPLASKEDQRAVEELKRTAEQLYNETRTAAEKYGSEVARINQLHNEGTISYDTAKRKLDQLKEEYDAATGATERHRAAQSDAQQVYQATRTDAENYASEVNRLSDLLRLGYISQETYARAVEQARDAFKSSNEDLRDAQSLIDSTRTASEQFATQLERFRDLREKGLIDNDTFKRAKDQLAERLGLDGANRGLNEATKISTQGALVGGQRAGQIFGASDTIAKQALQIQKQQLDEAKRTRQALEKPFAFSP